jgi:hypothetical protein
MLDYYNNKSHQLESVFQISVASVAYDIVPGDHQSPKKSVVATLPDEARANICGFSITILLMTFRLGCVS